MRLVFQGPPVSDPLAHVQPGPGEGGGVFPYLAGKSFSAVTALEDLQAVGAFLALFGANFALPQHRLADFGPEVASAAVTLRAVGRAQARVALVTFERDLGLSFAILPPAFVFDRKRVVLLHW